MVKSSIGIFLLSLVASLAWTPAGTWAAGEPDRFYGLDRLEALAVENSPEVKAAEERLNAAKAESGQVGYQYGPEFVFRATHESRDRTEGISDAGEVQNRVSGRVQQDLVQLFKVRPHKCDEALAKLDEARADLDESRARALSDFRQAYLDGLGAKLQAEAYGRIAGIYADLLKIRQKRLKASEGLPGEVLKAERELASSQTLRRRHADYCATVKNALAQSSGVPAESIVFKKPGIPPLAEEGQYLAVVSENRALVRKYQARAKQEASRGAIAGVDNVRLYPYVGYYFEDTDVGSGTRNGPEAGVVFSIPIFTGKVREYGKEKYKHLEEAWKLEERQAAQEVKRQIRLAYRRLELADSGAADAVKAAELGRAEIRTEKARLRSPVAGIPADPARVLELEAEVESALLEKDLAEVKKAAAYYELLYLAGLDGPAPHRDMDRGETIVETPAAKALWVWKSDRLLEEGPLRRFLVDACRSKKVDRVYLSVNRRMRATFPENPALAALVSELHGAGAAVSALIGDGNWVYPDNRDRLDDALEKIGAYNRACRPVERFDAVHLDIEPQSLAESKEGGVAEKQKLLELLAQVCKDVKARLPEMGENVKLEVDVPLFFRKVSRESLDGIFAGADTVVFMAYQVKNSEKLAAALRDEAASVNRKSGRFVVGLRAKDFASGAELDRFADAIRAQLRGAPGFDGFAVHDCDQYRDLVTR